MTRSIAGAILYFFGLGSTYAQPANPPLTFEVASIKPAPPPNGRGMRVFGSGGPGTSDPGRFATENSSLSALVTQAFDIRSYQLSGPDWMGRALFNIVAKVPEGATKEQFRLMLQNLLIERFKLVFHRDKTEMPIYEMVLAKDGPKFKETVDDPAAAPPPPGGLPQLGKDGFPIMQPGRTGMIVMNGRGRWQAKNQTMEQVANMLSGQAGRPVFDATGLKARYDLSLFWARDGMARMADEAGTAPGPGGAAVPQAGIPEGDSGPTIFTAIQQQLGLKLEPKKGMIDILVIDHLEKMPTEN
jgi:uncharacterized protein (TIGR03435 family)